MSSSTESTIKSVEKRENNTGKIVLSQSMEDMTDGSTKIAPGKPEEE